MAKIKDPATKEAEEEDRTSIFIHNQQRLDPTGALPPQDWIERPGVAQVMDVLNQGDGEARFVGGAVRDAIIKRPVNDVDIATPLLPEVVTERLEAAGVRVIETGLKHGTVTAVIGSETIEITTLRRDLATDGRHAEVAFTDSWMKDAARRDFTFNALSCGLDRQIYDPFDGMQDLAKGRVRFIGAPKDRIEEDYLRILRFFRFYASHGRPPIDRAAVSACRQAAANLTKLSAERIQAELIKILASDNVAHVLEIMRDELILEPILPALQNVGVLRIIAWLETRALPEGTLRIDTMRRLAALIGPNPMEAEQTAAAMKLSNIDTDRLISMCQPAPDITAEMPDTDRLGQLYRYGRDVFVHHVLLNWARERNLDSKNCHAQSPGWQSLLHWALDTEVPTFPLQGQDLLDLGLRPGPKVGKTLRQLEASWLEGGLTASKDELLSEARAFIV